MFLSCHFLGVRLLRTFRSWVALSVLFGLFCASRPVWAISAKQLPPTYRKWLEEDVAYISTQAERQEFLKLTTNDQRDHYIEQFWESRNPTPHSPINTFKEEHYRRLAYVRSHFGDERYDDGWRTDMGQVYITLGQPQQRGQFHMGISTRPVEIWFYQSPSPALPPYFNLVFYKRSEADPYTLYSPRQDGPTRIVTNDLHDDVQALHVIDQSMGSEAAHTMISLIPGEPTDLKNPQPTALSDNLLDEVRNLPEQRLERDRIARQRAASSEKVTVSIFNAQNRADLGSVVLRGKDGEQTVHVLFRERMPDPDLIGTLPDGRLGYNLSLRMRVMSTDGKAIYERRQTLTGGVSEAAAKAAREKIFAAEGRLPLVPGGYVVEATLTNQLTHSSLRNEATVRVTDAEGDGLGISGLMAYRGSPVRDMGGQLPFSIAGVRFPPRGEEAVDMRVGENLPLAFQIWLGGPQKAGDAGPGTVHAHYVVAPLSDSGDASRRLEEDEDIGVKDVDRAGNLLTGHKLQTTNLPAGTYRLMVKLTQPGRSGAAFSSMTVHVVPSPQPVEMWSAFSEEQQEPLWQDSLFRGISAEVQGDATRAAACFKLALQENPDSTEARTRLQSIEKKVAQQTPAAR